MKLVIVESPTKARTLSRYLPKDFAVEASMGHVRDLPKSRIGVDVEHNFEPEYVTVKGKGKIVKKLKDKAKGAKEVYLAMDPDREGEAIAYHVGYLLAESTGKNKKKKGSSKDYKRVTFHEITKEALDAAMQEPTVLNIDLVDAQQARRVLDRLVGYNLSPLLWKKVRRGLSAGRVQSVALKLIVEREKEIGKFKPQEYWVIAVELAKKESSEEEEESLVATLEEVEGEKIVVKGSKDDKKKGMVYLDSKEQVKPIETDLKGANYVVTKVDRNERKRRAFPPYTTSTLQQAASNTMGWSGRQTMRIAQELYEKGLITYHRTDSTYLASVAVKQVRKMIEKEYGSNYLPKKPVFYKTKSKSAQEAHEAVRPTKVSTTDLQATKRKVTSRHERLYRLIWQRFVSCQMMPAIYDQTTVMVGARNKKEYVLRATGRVMKFEGWRVVYKKQVTKDKERDEESELPELTEEEKLKYLGLETEQKETLPPPRFNDASLVKELEKRGIGRPSTYAPIISTIIDRGYIERLEKRFHPSSVGVTVTKFLDSNFPDIMDYDFSAQMEDQLDRVAEGEKDWRKVMKDFYTPFAKKVTKVEKEAKRMGIPVEKTGEKCPECKKGEVVIRTGRFGKFYSCSRFPECKHTANYTEKLEGFACPECKGEVVMKRTRKGRSFWGCSNYPKCDYASWKDPRQQKEKE